MSLIEAPAPNPRPAPSDESEGLVIAPTVAPLSATDAGGRDPRIERGGGFHWPWRHARLPLIGGLLIVLGTAAVFVLLLPSSFVEKTRAALPSVLAPSAETPADQAVAGSSPARAAVTETAQPPPYQAMQVTLARQAAREQLARFSELQLRLEDELNVDAWGADAVRAAEDMALAGDGLFRQEDYAGANQEYAAAVAALERLLVEGQRASNRRSTRPRRRSRHSTSKRLWRRWNKRPPCVRTIRALPPAAPGRSCCQDCRRWF